MICDCDFPIGVIGRYYLQFAYPLCAIGRYVLRLSFSTWFYMLV